MVHLSARNWAKQSKLSAFLCHQSFLLAILLLLTLTQVLANDANFACDVATDPELARFGFCNTKLTMEERVHDLVSRMTLEEKILFLGNTQPGIPRLGIPKLEWWSEALHGISYAGPGTKFSPLVPGATSFPTVILTAASFNVSLFQAIGKAVSTEARALYNVKLAGLTFWSPNINIYRDPRWGRGMETPGEDPLLVSLYGIAYVKGLQERDDGQKDKLKVAACCKHYTASDVGNWNGIDRFHFNANVTKQDLEDTFKPPFQRCVENGKAASVMCSYNQINGVPTCANPQLLAGVVRGQWKLNGSIVSDCDSVKDFFKNQNYTKTPEEAAAKALLAGVNLDCGAYLTQYTAGAVKAGLVQESVIDSSITYNVATLVRLGFFDGNPKNHLYGNLGPKDVCTQANQELARDAARQGIVLLKNDKGALPLDRKKKVAVIGPNADVTHDMIGHDKGTPCKYTTPLQGIKSVVADTKFSPGCDNIFCTKPSVDDAKKMASMVDATILVVGANRSIEEEGHDRNNITLPGQQQFLVTEVAKVSKGPIILVIMSGGGMDVQFAKDNPKISAILWVGYPGEAGGSAIADVIFGSYNPSGRLPMTWYPQSFVKNVPMTNMNMRADPSGKYPGRSYRFYTGPTVYSFGDGLSYTEFAYNLVKVPREVTVPLHQAQSCLPPRCYDIDLKNSKSAQFAVELKVRNSGRVSGSHTVLLFVTHPPVHKSPQKQLVMFKKVFLAAQSETAVTLPVDVGRDLSLADELGNRRIALGRYDFSVGSLTFPLTVRIT